MSDTKINLFSFGGKERILHLSWFAFFLTFVVWFSHAPLMASIRDTFGLSDQEVKMLLILNVALTIPARIIIGMLVDAFGPRRIYTFLLFVSSFLYLHLATVGKKKYTRVFESIDRSSPSFEAAQRRKWVLWLIWLGIVIAFLIAWAAGSGSVWYRYYAQKPSRILIPVAGAPLGIGTMLYISRLLAKRWQDRQDKQDET